MRVFTTSDPLYGNVTVRAWARLHPRLRRQGRWAGHAKAPIVAGWAIRAEVTHLPKRASNHPPALWLWSARPGEHRPRSAPDCWWACAHRFDIEHTIRLEKSTLGWVTPALRLPEQADRWTAIILAACAQLVLARPLAADLRLPWEHPLPGQLTPGRVRRDFPDLRAMLPPTANPRKPCHAGPDGPKDAPPTPPSATR